MNILYFTRNMGVGGTEKVILQLTELMIQSSNNVIICSSGGENVELAKKIGAKHCIIQDIQQKNPISIIKNFIKLYRIIKYEQVNVVHTHHRMAAFYTKILSFFCNFTFIHTAHNTFYDKRRLTRFSLDNVELIAVGEQVKLNLINEYGLKPSKISVIYNAVPEDNSVVETIPEIEKYKKAGYFTVGNIGRLSEQKGMEYFIEAANILVSKLNKNMKFFIIGDGEDRIKLESLIESYNLENSVFLLGYRKDVLNLMKQLDVIVLTSLWEGLPLTPIEAFSVKKTVIGTEVDGTPEIIKNNYNGLLIPSKNIEKICENILYLQENEEVKKRFESNAYLTYIDKFSFDSFEKKYYEYYKRKVGDIL